MNTPQRAAQTGTADTADQLKGSQDNWHISLRFGPDVFRKGLDPLPLLVALRQLGKIVGIVAITEALPPLDQIDAESCYLGFEIALASDADKTAIDNVFDAARNDSSIRILPPHSRISEYMRLITELPEKFTLIGEILVSCGSVTARELDNALSAQTGAAQKRPIGEILVEQGMVPSSVVEAALVKQGSAQTAKAQKDPS